MGKAQYDYKGGQQTPIERRHPGLAPGSMSLTLTMTPDP
jgi:hypothetical protein